MARITLKLCFWQLEGSTVRVTSMKPRPSASLSRASTSVTERSETHSSAPSSISRVLPRANVISGGELACVEAVGVGERQVARVQGSGDWGT